jgi:hypothetical protein
LNKFNDDIKYRNLLEKIGNKLLEFANTINHKNEYILIYPVDDEELSYYSSSDSIETTNN